VIATQKQTIWDCDRTPTKKDGINETGFEKLKNSDLKRKLKELEARTSHLKEGDAK